MSELELLNYIKQTGIQTIGELDQTLEISAATIRRRLQALADAGLLSLSRGGQVILVDDIELSVNDKFKQKRISSGQIAAAKIAANKVEDGDTIFIDNGTTVRLMLKHLEGKNIKIYTNGIFHTQKFNFDLDLNIIPGKLLIKEASIVGEEAIAYIADLHLDKVFIGANGYDESGVYTPHRSEMLIKRFVLNRGRQSYIVMDSAKSGHISKYQICECSQYPMITERTI